jgi:hypothetical protein
MPTRLPTRTVPSQPVRREFSFLTTVLLPILIVILLFSGLEIFARSHLAARIFPLRSYGNYHAQFEIKWQKLAEFVRQNGGVDVILLGSSMVNTGIDPAVFSSQLTLSDPPLRVFNFGVEGLTVVPMADLAELLVDTYHPLAIIYFTEMRDYLAGNGDDTARTFLENEWLRYRISQKSPIGWAVDHSAALQMLLPLRQWPRADFLDTYLQNLRRLDNTRLDGYEPEIQQTEFTGELPDPADPQDREFFALYGNYSIADQRLESLMSMLMLFNKGTYILVTEFPAYPGFYQYFGGEQVHTDYLVTIEDFILKNGGTFIPPIDPNLIPLNGRSDDHHLNSRGAAQYSTLLGKQFNLLCQNEGFCLERR